MNFGVQSFFTKLCRLNVSIGNVSNAQHLFTSKKMLKPKATKLNFTLFKLRLNSIKDCFMQVTCWKKHWRCKGKTFSYSLLSKSHWMISDKTFLDEDADSSDWIHVTQWRHKVEVPQDKVCGSNKRPHVSVAKVLNTCVYYSVTFSERQWDPFS